MLETMDAMFLDYTAKIIEMNTSEIFLGHPRKFQRAYCNQRNPSDFAKFRKFQEAIWLTVINEIFKFPPHFEPFGYVNYLHELALGYSSYPTQK